MKDISENLRVIRGLSDSQSDKSTANQNRAVFDKSWQKESSIFLEVFDEAKGDKKKKKTDEQPNHYR